MKKFKFCLMLLVCVLAFVGCGQTITASKLVSNYDTMTQNHNANYTIFDGTGEFIINFSTQPEIENAINSLSENYAYFNMFKNGGVYDTLLSSSQSVYMNYKHTLGLLTDSVSTTSLNALNQLIVQIENEVVNYKNTKQLFERVCNYNFDPESSNVVYNYNNYVKSLSRVIKSLLKFNNMFEDVLLSEVMPLSTDNTVVDKGEVKFLANSAQLKVANAVYVKYLVIQDKFLIDDIYNEDILILQELVAQFNNLTENDWNKDLNVNQKIDYLALKERVEEVDSVMEQFEQSANAIKNGQNVEIEQDYFNYVYNGLISFGNIAFDMISSY